MSEIVGSSTGTVNGKHLAPLDGFRGLAIILVMIQHFAIISPTAPAGGHIMAFADGGWLGVDLFFVLSGYLITGILIDSKGASNYFSKFYIRRAFRILPLFLLIAVLSFIVIPLSGLLPPDKAARFGSVGDDQWMYWLFLSNIAIAKFGSFRHGIMDVTWSLSIEEQFYIVWPILVLIFRKHLFKIAAAILIISFATRIYANAEGLNRNVIYVFTLFRMDGLAAGAMVAIAQRSSEYGHLVRKWSLPVMATGLAGLALSALLGGGLSYYYSSHMIDYGILFGTIGFTGILMALVTSKSPLLETVFSSRFLGFIGSLSYCLYLIHLPIRAAVRDLVMPVAWVDASAMGGAVGQLVFFAVSFVLCVAMAWVSKVAFEGPLTEFGRTITSTPRTAAPAL